MPFAKAKQCTVDTNGKDLLLLVEELTKKVEALTEKVDELIESMDEGMMY